MLYSSHTPRASTSLATSQTWSRPGDHLAVALLSRILHTPALALLTTPSLCALAPSALFTYALDSICQSSPGMDTTYPPQQCPSSLHASAHQHWLFFPEAWFPWPSGRVWTSCIPGLVHAEHSNKSWLTCALLGGLLGSSQCGQCALWAQCLQVVSVRSQCTCPPAIVCLHPGGLFLVWHLSGLGKPVNLGDPVRFAFLRYSPSAPF